MLRYSDIISECVAAGIAAIPAPAEKMHCSAESCGAAIHSDFLGAFFHRCRHFFFCRNAGMAAHSLEWAAIPTQTRHAKMLGYEPSVRAALFKPPTNIL